MEPECSPGDLAVIDCDAIPEVGQVVVALINGEHALRYLQERNDERLVLSGENPMVADIVSAPADVEIIGVVISYQRLPKRRPRQVRRVG